MFLRRVSHRWELRSINDQCVFITSLYLAILTQLAPSSTMLRKDRIWSSKMWQLCNLISGHLLGFFPSSLPAVISFIKSGERQTTLIFKFLLYIESLCVWYLKRKHLCFIIMYLYLLFFLSVLDDSGLFQLPFLPGQYQDVIWKHENTIRIYKTQYRLYNMIFKFYNVMISYTYILWNEYHN